MGEFIVYTCADAMKLSRMQQWRVTMGARRWAPAREDKGFVGGSLLAAGLCQGLSFGGDTIILAKNK